MLVKPRAFGDVWLEPRIQDSNQRHGPAEGFRVTVSIALYWSWLVKMAPFSNSAFVRVWLGPELSGRGRVGDCGIQHPSRYLVYVNNRAAGKGSLKIIDLRDQKTAP